MALPKKSLVVKKSTIPNAGKGVFTKKFIPKGTRIVEYKGKVITWKDAEKMADSENGYVFHFTNNYCLDARRTKKSVAGFVNDARGMVRLEGLKNNTEYVTVKKRCFIEATKNIPAGSELFVGYGAEYWRVIRYNARIDEENQAKNVKKSVASKKE
jgi:SET domain-containing protein